MRTVRFAIALDIDVRLRHVHRTDRGRVIGFVVQLEILDEGEWQPVIRYDSAHGSAHGHRFCRKGKNIRTALSLELPDALTFAEGDLRTHWERYVKEYRA